MWKYRHAGFIHYAKDKRNSSDLICIIVVWKPKENHTTWTTRKHRAVCHLERERSYASYTYDHVENIIKKLRDMLCDVECAIGLSKTTKAIIIREALSSIDFLKNLMEDSRQFLGKIEFISYCDPGPDAMEECCKDEG